MSKEQRKAHKEFKELWKKAPPEVKKEALKIAPFSDNYFRELVKGEVNGGKLPSIDSVLISIYATKQAYKNKKLDHTKVYDKGEKAIEEIEVTFEELKNK